jgi:AbrB family looped-hinge helix DNA binding protein
MVAVAEVVKLTSQHQITIPKRIREALGLHGGDRLELVATDDQRIMLRRTQLINEDDPAYQLAQQIVESERQIAKGNVVPWSEIKRRHKL